LRGGAKLGAIHEIARALEAYYDPLQQRGEVPLAREQRKLAAILAVMSAKAAFTSPVTRALFV